MIEVRKATVIYDDGSWGIRDADFIAEKGELIALTGPNGGGKTTLLRLISGLIPSFYKAKVKGEVLVDGVNPLLGPSYLGGIVGYTQPDPNLQVVGVTVYAEAALGPAMHGLSRGEIKKRALEALSRTGLRELAGRSTSMLSSGILQRVAIAGILSIQPRYLLLDEPTAHLDEPSSDLILELLQKLTKEGVGIIAATHDQRVVEIVDKSYIVSGSIRPGVWSRVKSININKIKRFKSNISKEDTALYADSVWASYPDGIPVLRGVSIEAKYGSLISIIGPNGSGKTTLLRVLAGLIKPVKGFVKVYGKRAYLPPDPIMVFSKPTLRSEINNIKKENIKINISHVAKILDKPIMSLSRGQLQLAALFLVASSGARILLLDEPTYALDPEVKTSIVETLLELASQGYCIIAATHDTVLANYSNEVYYMEDGVLRKQ